MSRGHNGGVDPKLELKLNLSPPRGHTLVESPSRSSTSSCVSSELNYQEETAMVLVGCPNCLMYVMLSETDPKCPKCKSSVLLDFLHHTTASKKI